MMPMRMGCLALFAVLLALDFARAIFGFPSTAGLICPSLSRRRVTRLLGLACHAPTISVCGAPQLQFISSVRSEEHTSELQSRLHLVCRLLLEKKKNKKHSSTRSAIH